MIPMESCIKNLLAFMLYFSVCFLTIGCIFSFTTEDYDRIDHVLKTIEKEVNDGISQTWPSWPDQEKKTEIEQTQKKE